jgi:deoxyribodipyrimidine photo-lyase
MNRKTPIDRYALHERLSGCFTGEPKATTLRGGRTEALRLLDAYDPAGYGRGRNFLAGPVSKLSPYIRHGMISLVEVRDRLSQRFTDDPSRLEEFFRQLAWRDYFAKVLAWHGRGLEEAIEQPKHNVARDSRIPLDMIVGETGLPCIDGMLANLYQDGYLHNHARLWFAAYWCHFRGLDWLQGARLFRRFLLDGDTASNFASWQWVESTFAAKPYFMNKENIKNFSGGQWCDGCQVACPFDRDYPDLQNWLFGGAMAPLAKKPRQGYATTDVTPVPLVAKDPPFVSRPSDIIWVHDAALSWASPAIVANPMAPVIFVFNEPAMRAEPPAWHRVAFILDGIDDLITNIPNPGLEVPVGDPVDILERVALAAGAETIHLEQSHEPANIEIAERLRGRFRVVEHPAPELARYDDEPKRFSRYWDKAAAQVTGKPAKRGGKWHR